MLHRLVTFWKSRNVPLLTIGIILLVALGMAMTYLIVIKLTVQNDIDRSTPIMVLTGRGGRLSVIR